MNRRGLLGAIAGLAGLALGRIAPVDGNIDMGTGFGDWSKKPPSAIGRVEVVLESGDSQDWLFADQEDLERLTAACDIFVDAKFLQSYYVYYFAI